MEFEKLVAYIRVHRCGSKKTYPPEITKAIETLNDEQLLVLTKAKCRCQIDASFANVDRQGLLRVLLNNDRKPVTADLPVGAHI